MQAAHVSNAPYSTGHHPRPCRICGASFVGLGDLCPVHLAAHARQRANEIAQQRITSARILRARETQTQPKRTEWVEELDA